MSDASREWSVDWSAKPIELLVAQVTSGGTPTSGDPRYYTPHGGLPFAKTEDLTRADSKFVFDCELQITDAALKESAAKRYPAGTILLSMYGTIGLAKITGQEMAANQALCALIPPFSCNRDYLFHHLEWMRPEWARFSGQTTQPNINGATVRSRLVPIPPSGEQKAIAAVLDTLDTAIRETEAIIAKLKAVKQGLLNDLLTRGIDANGELRPPQPEAPHLYKQSPLGWLPKEWNVRGIASLADVRSGSTPARAQAGRYFSPNGIPWVKTLDLNEDQIVVTDERITSDAVHETSCVVLPAGTVLVAMYGGWEQIGRTALLAVPAATNQAISALIFDQAEVAPEFMLRALQHGRPRWHEVAASTRKDPNITKADVLAFKVPLPPLDEQVAVAKGVRASLARLDSETATLAKLRREKAGLMDDLLTGRVRVTPLLSAEPQAQTRST